MRLEEGVMEQQGSAAHNRAVLEQMRQILGAGQYERLEECLTPDFVQEMPQSGERVVGIENFRQIIKHIAPEGGLGVADDPYVAGDEEHYVVTPTFNVVKVMDRGDEITSYVKSVYPDGSEWYIVTFTSFRDGKICKRVDFFAPFYDPPEWRARWAERY
jgi:hypothetical protein